MRPKRTSSSGTHSILLPKVTVGWHERLLDIRFYGDVVGTDLDSVVLRVQSLTANADRVLLDASSVTNYDLTIRAPGLLLLAHLKKIGASRVAVVAKKPSVRMIGQALLFASGLGAVFFEERDQALAWLSKEE